jgi:MFS family permease
MAMLPVTALMLVLSPRMGAVADRIGPRIPLTVGPVVIALGMALLTRVGPDTSFVTDVLPGVFVFGLGLSIIVAPVTSTALGAAPDSRAGAASGVNNAVARTGGLLAVSAVPGLVGLTGDALGDPAQLGPGFDEAMLWSAGMVAAAGVATFALLPRGVSLAEEAPAESDVSGPLDERVHAHSCPVDGQASSVAA